MPYDVLKRVATLLVQARQAEQRGSLREAGQLRSDARRLLPPSRLFMADLVALAVRSSLLRTISAIVAKRAELFASIGGWSSRRGEECGELLPEAASFPGLRARGRTDGLWSEPNRDVSGYVDAALRGRLPAELPSPTKFEFILNQRTANALRVADFPCVSWLAPMR